MTSSPNRRVVGTLLLALALPAPATALDVKLWPLFRYARDDATADVRWSALGPLLEFKQTTETREFFVRPVLHIQQRRGPHPDDRADIFYPLASSRWQGDYQAFRLLLFTYRSQQKPRAPAGDGEPPPPEWVSRFTLFPLVFYRRTPEEGRQLSVVPVYADVDDLFGYENVKMVLFPAYLRLQERRVERRFYLFPFFSTIGGPAGRGMRVWPIYGDKEIVGTERTRYVLWPFHIRSERLVPGYGWEQRRINFPAYAAIDGAGRQMRSYGVVAYTHTLDFRRGREATGSPWPLVVRERPLGEEEYDVWRAFPAYSRSDREGRSSRFYAWPVYRRRSQDVDDFHYERRDVGLVLWRRQRLHNDTSGRDESLVTAFPVLRSERQDGRAFGQVPAVFDSLLPKARGVLSLWAPLYGLIRWDTRPTGVLDWNTFFGLVARENGELLGPWHLALEGSEDEETLHGG